MNIRWFALSGAIVSLGGLVMGLLGWPIAISVALAGLTLIVLDR